MGQAVADLLLDRLHAWAVRRIYGYPGDGINGLMVAMNRASDKLDFHDLSRRSHVPIVPAQPSLGVGISRRQFL